jgi:hypothetical protein
MYKIIGADKKEYGPVTVDQIRQWIAEGRVNGQTVVQAEGSTDWRPLASFPEFTSLLTPQPTAAPGMPPPPGLLPAAPQPAASSQVQGPAIALMIVAGLNFLLTAVGLIMNLAGAGMGRFGPIGNPELEKLLEMTSGIAGVISNLVSLGIAALIFVGAQKMKNVQNYGLAMTATILAMVPCVSPCCLIGLPIGIWSLVVLLRPEVKSAFP